ncbi:MAG: ADP-forming succinate--CoA ligase subunit beta [Clostridia bacterium]|nr:ADP-forming succinate--CoA ligase subunit beta [Clostridia bacterium]
MKLLEYQAKAIFDKCGLTTMPGCVIDNIDDAPGIIEAAGLNYPVVVKAQVQIGGRGKAGGIRFANDPDEAFEHCRALLGSEIRGLRVDRLLIVEKAYYTTEWYLSIMLDRLTKRPMIMFSANGGMEIEQTARDNPASVKKIIINPMTGVNDYMARYLLSDSGLDLGYTKALYGVIKGLYDAFNRYDAMLVEINPLVAREDMSLIALDGKVDIDDSALYRLPEVASWRDEMPEDDLVRQARSFDFLYIPIEKGGTIAVCSNGSGMLMSCIDMISKEGMRVAAALDLGGGATKERIREAMRILFSTPGVKAVLINIFGGITRCDEVAGGVKLAMDERDLEGKIIVIRMEGTNKDAGIAIIEGLNSDQVLPADGLRESIAHLTQRRDML